MTIHLRSYGQGTPLVFFHGWGFDGQIWLPLLADLEKNYQLIFVDLPGFGLTPMMDWLDFSRELLQLLPQQFSLVGWSMGGLFAMRLALEAPERVRHLLCIASSPYFIMDDVWPGIPPQVFLNFYRNLSLDIKRSMQEFISLQMGSAEVDIITGNLPTQAGLRAGLAILQEWDLRDDLQSLQMPTLFLFGRLDPITPVKTMKAMELRYPLFDYQLINHCSHMPFLSHKKEFISALTGLIE